MISHQFAQLSTLLKQGRPYCIIFCYTAEKRGKKGYYLSLLQIAFNKAILRQTDLTPLIHVSLFISFFRSSLFQYFPNACLSLLPSFPHFSFNFLANEWANAVDNKAAKHVYSGTPITRLSGDHAKPSYNRKSKNTGNDVQSCPKKDTDHLNKPAERTCTTPRKVDEII